MKKKFKYISMLSFISIPFVPKIIIGDDLDIFSIIEKVAYSFGLIVFLFSVGITSFIYNLLVLKEKESDN